MQTLTLPTRAAHPVRDELRIVSFPDVGAVNQYLNLYYGALARYGFSLARGIEYSDGALREYASRIGFIHLHWGRDQFWRSAGKSWIGQARKLAGLWRYLQLARKLGVRVVWTVHDLDNPDGTILADRIGNRILGSAADLCIFHTEHMRDLFLTRNLGRAERTLIMPHGNYDGVFPVPADRSETLAKLGLSPARRTLLACGLIRHYKGFDLAIDALSLLGPDYQLVIAGPASDPDTVSALQSRSTGAVSIIAQDLTDQDVADLHAAADCVLLPYRRVSGSGSMLTSFTLGRAVVATDLPFFREYLAASPAAGELCQPNSVPSLTEAITKFFRSDVASRHAAARAVADQFPWSSVVGPVAERLLALARSR